ncbi:Glyoxylase, beta-lactamase superfamily II [Jiangella alkaliphila]|uniref:Glyoxylase, beta-lactamase superfamily II n=2 Tax=Jiangella alkaliphila TaxID=419479 RepID=A0A1H2GTH8_9ACTN|nr:MBL fold metallo-hydrolase [Jiangella alkaliphila]SDU22924.1 Glyoxylase, beta-lactamase superfamily II [Jiangella alkaliphila]
MTDVVLPEWCRLVRADNPGPMTLDGTNTYVLRTADGIVVIDPGPWLEEHLDAVLSLGSVSLALVTHHHEDHCGGIELFRELTGGAPVLARDPAASGADAELPAHGERLDDLGLLVLDTPGHTADSVSFVADDGESVLLFSGDTVLGRGTTIVSHPDGDLGDYLASLELLRTAVPRDALLLPGHGPLRPHAVTVVDEYIAHRKQRIEQVRAALAGGATTARDVVEVVYADVDRTLWPAAELTVEATLAYLRATG